MVELILGIIIGLLLAISTLWIFRVKCQKCQKLKPLYQTILFSWRSRQITGQPCQQCQKPKSPIIEF